MNLLEKIRPETSATDAFSKNVLNVGELKGSLTTLGAGAENASPEAATDRVLFLAQGSVTATVSGVKYVLNADETLVVAQGKPYSIRNHGDSPARIFILTLPAVRQSAPPPVVLG